MSQEIKIWFKNLVKKSWNAHIREDPQKHIEMTFKFLLVFSVLEICLVIYGLGNFALLFLLAFCAYYFFMIYYVIKHETELTELEDHP